MEGTPGLAGNLFGRWGSGEESKNDGVLAEGRRKGCVPGRGHRRPRHSTGTREAHAEGSTEIRVPVTGGPLNSAKRPGARIF